MKIAVAAGLIAMSLSSTSPAATIADGIKADMPQLMALYRDIHANPELSMQEVRTPAKLAAEMRKLGFEVTEHVGKTGVVAVMKNGPGPVLLIRADMDALPVKAQTGLPFASTVIGKLPDGTPTPVMHACGHDTHIATWLGTGRRLAAMKEAGCDRILIAPLYPQYCAATTATANDKAFAALAGMRWQPAVRTLPPYHDDPAYIDALAASVRAT